MTSCTRASSVEKSEARVTTDEPIKHINIMETIYNEMQKLFVTFFNEADKALTGNKASGVRARKATLEIEKLCKDFRKVSVKAGK